MFGRSKKRKKQEPKTAFEQAIAVLAQQHEEQAVPASEASNAGILLYSAAVGVVGASGASFFTDPVSAGMFGASAALVPPALAYAFEHSKELLEAAAQARNWLDEQQHKRLLAELEARKAAQAAAKAKWEVVERLQIVSARISEASKRGAMPASEALEAFEQRRKWQRLLAVTYEDGPKSWQGGQPFGKGRLCELFGKQEGATIYNKLVALKAVVPNGRQPQWSYALVGATQEEALDWIEANGLV